MYAVEIAGNLACYVNKMAINLVALVENRFAPKDDGGKLDL